MLHREGFTTVSVHHGVRAKTVGQNCGSDLHLCNLYLRQVQCQRWQVLSKRYNHARL